MFAETFLQSKNDCTLKEALSFLPDARNDLLSSDNITGICLYRKCKCFSYFIFSIFQVILHPKTHDNKNSDAVSSLDQMKEPKVLRAMKQVLNAA